MKCRHCDEILVCASCGVQQTLRKDGKKKTYSMSMDPASMEKIDAEAEKLGISRSEYFQRMAEESL